MTLDIPAAIEDGLARLPTRVAAILFVAYLAVGALSTITSQTLGAAFQDWVRDAVPAANPGTGGVPAGGMAPGTGGASPLALDVGVAVALVLFLAQVVLAQAVGVVTIRTFVSGARDRFPEDLSRRFGWVVLNALVVSVVVGIATFVGLIFLILPGIYLAVALYFVEFEVIVEDKGVVDALRDGWALTAGERLSVFLLLVVLFIIGLISGIPGIVLGFVGAPELVTVAVSLVVSAVTSLLAVAIGSRAYVQLKGEDWTPPGSASPFAY
jgi:hypothetical protein